jgi:hypothetical protein
LKKHRVGSIKKRDLSRIAKAEAIFMRETLHSESSVGMVERNIAAFLVIGVMAASIATSGCATFQPITYDVSKVASGRPLEPTKVLNVRILRDARRLDPENSILFSGDKETVYQGKTVCVNSERHYETGTVPRQVTALIASHLRHRKSFKNVVFGESNGADYQLVGTLSAFYVRQDFDYGAAVGSAFGLIGALMTAGNTNPTEIRIAFTGLELYDRNGTLLGRPEDVFFYEKSPQSSDAYCFAVYQVANDHLYKAVSKLADSVESMLKGSGS